MFLERMSNMRDEYKSMMSGRSMGWLLSTTDKWWFL
jgi:hypothetical protein